MSVKDYGYIQILPNFIPVPVLYVENICILQRANKNVNIMKVTNKTSSYSEWLSNVAILHKTILKDIKDLEPPYHKRWYKNWQERLEIENEIDLWAALL